MNWENDILKIKTKKEGRWAGGRSGWQLSLCFKSALWPSSSCINKNNLVYWKKWRDQDLYGNFNALAGALNFELLFRGGFLNLIKSDLWGQVIHADGALWFLWNLLQNPDLWASEIPFSWNSKMSSGCQISLESGKNTPFGIYNLE